jgi:hypothetical protein
VFSGRGLCDELITRPEEFYRLCCVVVCDLETSRIGAPYIYDISNLSVNARNIELITLIRCLYIRVHSNTRENGAICGPSFFVLFTTQHLIDSVCDSL